MEDLMKGVLTVLEIIGLRLAAGMVACMLGYLVVQWAIKPVLKLIYNGEKPEAYARLFAMGVGVMATMTWHGAAAPGSILSFGDGPAGWMQAALFGVLGAAFAGPLADKFSGKKKKENNVA